MERILTGLTAATILFDINMKNYAKSSKNADIATNCIANEQQSKCQSLTK